MKTQMVNNSNAPQNKIKALILSFIGVALSLILLCFGFIGEPSFISLIVISVVVGLFVCYSDVIKSFSLLKGELILRDIKETEASVKELAKAILEVTETSSHGIMRETFDGDAQNKAVEKLRKLTT